MQTLKEFKKKRLRKVAEKYEIDVLIGSSPENVFYVSNFKSISHEILNRTSAFALFNCKEQKISAAIPSADVATFIEQDESLEVVCFGEFYFSYNESPSKFSINIKDTIQNAFDAPTDGLIEAIKRTGLKKGKIGLDESRVTPQIWNTLVKTFPDIKFVPAEQIFSEVKKVKHTTEIGRLEKSATIAEESIHNALSKLEIGMTEEEFGKLYMEEVVQLGAKPYFNVITEGERTAFADTINTTNRIYQGSLLRFDFGCIYQGYRSDLARTAVIGEGSKKAEEYYEHILRGENDLIASIRPGITASEVYNITMNSVRKGIPHYRRQHVGHGIGLEVYDYPQLAEGVNEQLKENMVLCVETPYYEIGWGGVQVEDTVVVTENGCRLLTKNSRDLIKIGG